MDTAFTLKKVNGSAIDYSANIRFLPDGKVAGSAPCNRYFSVNKVPYPWFELGPIGSTKMACPELQHESAFLKALARMTLAEVSGNVLLLSNDADESLEFRNDT